MCHAWMQVISIDGFARRNRFILAVSLGLGLGVTLVPGWAEVGIKYACVAFASMVPVAVMPATDISSEVGTNRWVLLRRTTSGLSLTGCPTAFAASATLSSWCAEMDRQQCSSKLQGHCSTASKTAGAACIMASCWASCVSCP